MVRHCYKSILWNDLTGSQVGAVESIFEMSVSNLYLIYLLWCRDFKSRTSGTLLGWIWVFVQPTLQVVGFWFLLSVVLRVKYPGHVEFLSYFLSGMLPWLFIGEVLSRSLTVLSEFAALYQRSAFPVIILPSLPVLFSGPAYAVVFALVSAALFGGGAAFWGFLIIVCLMVWLVPFCYLLAVLGLFVKDTRQVFPFLLTLILYLTPIMYLPDMLPDGLRELVVLNPFADLMALIHGVLNGMPVSMENALRPWGLWALVLIPSWRLFRRVEPHLREAL